MIRRLAVAVLALAVLVGACSDDDATDDANGSSDSQWLAALADDVAVPAYTDLDGSLGALAEVISTDCVDGGEAQVVAAWGDARDAWERSQAVGIGPAMDVRIEAGVDFEVDAEKVHDLAASADPVDADALSHLGADVRGLSAIELLVIAPDDEMSSVPAARRCEYAQGAALAARDVAAQVLAAWTEGDGEEPPFAEQLADPDLATMQRDDLLNRVVEVLRESNMQLEAAALVAEQGEEAADPVDVGPAQRYLDDLDARLDGVAAVIGDPEAGTGLVVAVARASEETAARAAEQMATAQAALAALDRPLSAAIESDPDGVVALSEAVETLTATMATEVASQLGTTIGLGDSDGDS